MNARDLWTASRKDLAAAIAKGRAIAPDVLAGHDYRGVSLGLPAFVERLTWKTFRKSFRRAEDGGVEGFNVRLEQRGTDAAPEPKRARDGSPVTFGPFSVVPAKKTPFGCAEALVLDYGARHPAWHPMARVRDVLVALDDEGALLLGALYLDCGVRLETPSFFTLEREPLG